MNLLWEKSLIFITFIAQLASWHCHVQTFQYQLVGIEIIGKKSILFSYFSLKWTTAIDCYSGNTCWNGVLFIRLNSMISIGIKRFQFEKTFPAVLDSLVAWGLKMGSWLSWERVKNHCYEKSFKIWLFEFQILEASGQSIFWWMPPENHLNLSNAS